MRKQSKRNRRRMQQWSAEQEQAVLRLRELHSRFGKGEAAGAARARRDHALGLDHWPDPGQPETATIAHRARHRAGAPSSLDAALCHPGPQGHALSHHARGVDPCR